VIGGLGVRRGRSAAARRAARSAGSRRRGRIGDPNGLGASVHDPDVGVEQGERKVGELGVGIGLRARGSSSGPHSMAGGTGRAAHDMRWSRLKCDVSVGQRVLPSESDARAAGSVVTQYAGDLGSARP